MCTYMYVHSLLEDIMGGRWSCCHGEEDISSEWKPEKKILFGAKVPIDYTARALLLKSLSPALFTFEDQCPHNFHAKFQLGNELGHGAFAKVLSCTSILSDAAYAVKITSRRYLDETSLSFTLMEGYALQKLYHVHLMRFIAFYKDDENYYMVCEEMQGGPLLDVLSQKVKNYTEFLKKWDKIFH